MNKTVVSIIVVILVIAGWFFLFSGYNKNTEIKTPVSVQPTGVMIDPGQAVVIQGHKFLEMDLEIEAGTTVIWRNRDNFVGLPYDKHTITSGVVDRTGMEGVRGIVPNSGSGQGNGMYQKGLALNDVFDYTFTEPGIYTFYIAEHPLVSGEGRIIVTERTEPSHGETITMEAKSFSFSPDTLQAKIDEVIGLNITAIGQHTFTIDQLNVDVILLHGKTTRVEFTPEKIGTFEFYCAIPGHRVAGQIGTIVVE